MTKVCALMHGWTLHADEERNPWLLHRDGRRRAPAEMIYQPEAREIFRAIKRQLDIMDDNWRFPGNDARFRACDKAKLALHYALHRAGRWSDELLETGIEVRG